MTPEITMQDVLQWLAAQRDAANTRLAALGDGDESHAEHSPEAKAVRIINAIEARVKEMTAVEYLEAHNEMCSFYIKNGGGSCNGCPLDGTDPVCGHLVEEYPRRAVEIVKKWKEENT